MKNFLCLLTGLLLIAGCAAKKISKTSYLGAIKDKDFCEEFQCNKYALSKEKVNALAIECVEQEMNILPPMLTKSQVDELLPSIELCMKYKVKKAPIISKSDFLYMTANEDFFSNYPNASKFGITRLQINNIVMACTEQGLDSFPSEFSIEQLEKISFEINECTSNKLLAEAEIPIEIFFKKLNEEDILGRFPESKKFIELGIEKEEIWGLVLQCLYEESNNYPSKITLNQFDELLDNAEPCFMKKLETNAILSKTRIIKKVVQRMDLDKKYSMTAEYNIDRKELDRILISCLELVMQDLPSKISINQFMGCMNSEPQLESCINAKMIELK